LGKHSPIIHPAISSLVFPYISIWPGNAFGSGQPPNWVTLNFGLDASNAKVAVQPVGHKWPLLLQLGATKKKQKDCDFIAATRQSAAGSKLACRGIGYPSIQVSKYPSIQVSRSIELSPGEVLTLQAPGITSCSAIVDIAVRCR